MSPKELYQHCVLRLKNIYTSGESEEICERLLESLGHSRKPSNKLIAIDAGTLQVANEYLQRLINHEPIQYVTGTAWFYKMKLTVDTAVLIPRPETEELVAEAIAFLGERKQLQVLDIGTGSGCIPIALKRYSPGNCISSMDISQEALDIAQINATAQEVNVHLFRQDFLDESAWKLLPQFDMIISNPPYIPQKDRESMDKNVVEFEPGIALFVPDERPLLFYEKIMHFAKDHLKQDGKIFLEVHQNHAVKVQQLYNENRWEARLKKDINGNDRILVASRCQ